MPAPVRFSPADLVVALRRKSATENWIDCFVSDDDGTTWSFLSRVAKTEDGNQFNGNPPAMVRLADGRLVPMAIAAAARLWQGLAMTRVKRGVRSGSSGMTSSPSMAGLTWDTADSFSVPTGAWLWSPSGARRTVPRPTSKPRSGPRSCRRRFEFQLLSVDIAARQCFAGSLLAYSLTRLFVYSLIQRFAHPAQSPSGRRSRGRPSRPIPP